MKNSLIFEERRVIGEEPKELLARLNDLRRKYREVVATNASLHENLYDLAEGLDKRIAYLEKLIATFKN